MSAPPCPARRRMICWRAAAGYPGTTRTRQDSPNLRTRTATCLINTLRTLRGKRNPTPDHAAGLLAGDAVFHSPAPDPRGRGTGHAGRPWPPSWRRSSSRPWWPAAPRHHGAQTLRQRAEKEPNMNDLLDFVLDAHGGLKRWSGVSTLTAKLAVGGPFWGQQGFPDAFLDETLTIDTRRQHAVFIPWTAPGQSLTFDTDPERVVLRTANGQTIDSRTNLRSSYAGYDL